MKRTLVAVTLLVFVVLLAMPVFGQGEQDNKDWTHNLHSATVGDFWHQTQGNAAVQQAPVMQPPPPPPPPPPGMSVPIWSNTFIDSTDPTMKIWTYKMVGTDPSIAGAGTTNVPVVIIPLRVNFASGNASISPNNADCVDKTTPLVRVANSPLFNNNITWLEGNTIVGVTQFTDAFQRANFWSSVSTISPNYHVLLNPVQVTPEAFLNVPASLGGVIGFACAGHPIGGVSINYLDGFVRSLISSLNIPPTTFTLVVTYDVEQLLGNGGFFLGYHSAAQTPNGTWTYAIGSYTDPGILGLKVSDVSVLSHELGEWLDDPTGDNAVPSWGNVGQVQGCQSTLEVGDPLSGTNSTVFMNDGTTYTVQDLAFLSWFARDNPSRAVNGWFTTLNTFGSFSKPCPPPPPAAAN